MAKYFSTYYLNETVFQQQEEQESSKKYFIRYLNSFLMALAVVNFFLKESASIHEDDSLISGSLLFRFFLIKIKIKRSRDVMGIYQFLE